MAKVNYTKERKEFITEQEILRMVLKNKTQRELAAEYNMSTTTICNWIKEFMSNNPPKELFVNNHHLILCEQEVAGQKEKHYVLATAEQSNTIDIKEKQQLLFNLLLLKEVNIIDNVHCTEEEYVAYEKFLRDNADKTINVYGHNIHIKKYISYEAVLS